MQHPRDLREWQKFVERELKEARRSGSTLALAAAEKTAADFTDALNQYKGLVPAPPIEMNYQTAVYTDMRGFQRARLIADFPDVVFAMTGEDISVTSYELSGQLQGTDPAGPWQTLASSSESSFYVNGFIPGEQWSFRIRAARGTFVQSGTWSEETLVTFVEDTTPPPMPSDPVVTTTLGTTKVAWDGKATGGADMPIDFDHIDIAFGLATAPTDIIDTLAYAGFIMVPKSAYNTPHYFRFRAVDTSGNIGPWSVQATAIPVPLVDEDLILSEIDAAHTTIINIGGDAILDGAILNAKLGDNAVTQAKLAQTIQDNIASGVGAANAIPGINTNISSLQTSVNGKNTISRQTTTPLVTAGFVNGDRWEQWSTLAAGGKLLATWRFDGTQWLAESIDPTYLPQVDIGSGTFGSLNGSRLVTDSVGAKAIIVGDFTNLAIGSDFEDATAVPWTLAGTHTLSTTQKKSGTTSLRLAPVASSANPDKSVFTGDMRVKEAEQWYFRLQGYVDATFNGATNTKLRIGDQNNTALGTITVTGITPATWTMLDATVTVPAGVTSLTVQLWSDNTAGYAYVDDIQIRRVSEPSLIQNLGVEKLTASTASMGQAVIDKLWSDVVNSRKITTSMLSVSDMTNFAPSYRDSPNDWSMDGGMTSGTTGIAASVDGYRFTSIASSGSSRALGPMQFVRPGDELYGEGTAYRGGGPSTDAIYVRYYFYDKNKAYITSGGTELDGSAQINNPASGATGKIKAVVPSGAMYARIVGTINNTTGADLGIYNIRGYRRTGTVLIQDGAVTASTIAADAVTTSAIKALAITSAKIDVNTLTADTAWIGTLRGGVLITDAVTTSMLKADAITAKHTITGATIQTTTTVNRGLKMTSTGLQLFDATGTKTVDLNASTGYATLTGRLRTAADGNPGAVLIPPVESDDGRTMALWLAADVASLVGGVTAGVWMSNPATSSTAGKINIRGQQYGGITLWDGVEFATNTASLPQFFSNHGAGLQMTAYNGTLYMAGSGGEARVSALYNVVINPGGTKYFNMLRGGVAYNASISNAANLFLQTDGNVFKSTSASKFKILPEVMSLDDRLLDEVAVKDWIDKGSAERYADTFNQPRPWTEQQDREFQALSIARVPGAIAEDVVAAGGEAFVGRDLNGELESLMYERLALARTEILKRRVAKQADSIEYLLEKVAELEARLNALPA
jgi:hypothetical protein